jgi:fused signal recognition particle receptor
MGFRGLMVDSYFHDLREGLAKTRMNLSARIDEAATGVKKIDEFIEELEEVLILSDVGLATIRFLLDKFREKGRKEKLWNGEKVREIMSEVISEILFPVEKPLEVLPPYPNVILVLGVNGSGKTTTIGKIAGSFASQGRSVLLGAGDTFRAAAIEQLEIWGSRVGAGVVKHRAGADSSAVAFDCVKAALRRKIEVVLIDTAGRLHTNKNLMGELGKIKRVIQGELPHAPSEILLVVDATTGQNGIVQAKSFTESLGVTGLAVTKIDGTAKGGVIISISRDLGIPIRYVGVGEGEGDLKPFYANEFARAMLCNE